MKNWAHCFQNTLFVIVGVWVAPRFLVSFIFSFICPSYIFHTSYFFYSSAIFLSQLIFQVGKARSVRVVAKQSNVQKLPNSRRSFFFCQLQLSLCWARGAYSSPHTKIYTPAQAVTPCQCEYLYFGAMVARYATYQLVITTFDTCSTMILYCQLYSEPF